MALTICCKADRQLLRECGWRAALTAMASGHGKLSGRLTLKGMPTLTMDSRTSTLSVNCGSVLVSTGSETPWARCLTSRFCPELEHFEAMSCGKERRSATSSCAFTRTAHPENGTVRVLGRVVNNLERERNRRVVVSLDLLVGDGAASNVHVRIRVVVVDLQSTLVSPGSAHSAHGALTCASSLLIVAVKELGFEMAKLTEPLSVKPSAVRETSDADGTVTPEMPMFGGRANCDARLSKASSGAQR